MSSIVRSREQLAKNIFNRMGIGDLFSIGFATDYFILVHKYDDCCEVIELNQENRHKIATKQKPQSTYLYFKEVNFVSCLKSA